MFGELVIFSIQDSIRVKQKRLYNGVQLAKLSVSIPRTFPKILGHPQCHQSDKYHFSDTHTVSRHVKLFKILIIFIFFLKCFFFWCLVRQINRICHIVCIWYTIYTFLGPILLDGSRYIDELSPPAACRAPSSTLWTLVQKGSKGEGSRSLP